MKIRAITTAECESVDDFREKNPDAEILEIDGMEVVATCFVCNRAIIDGDEYQLDLEAGAICQECVENEIQKP